MGGSESGRRGSRSLNWCVALERRIEAGPIDARTNSNGEVYHELLVVAVLGRISIVVSSIYPLTSLRQVLAIPTGTLIVIGFAIYISSGFQPVRSLTRDIATCTNHRSDAWQADTTGRRYIAH